MIARALRASAACLVLILAAAAPVHAQDAVAAARELYAAAEYEDALAMLDALAAANHSRQDTHAIELYRTLCLLAIGRHEDAERGIEAMILQDPLYRPGDDVSPRMRTAFSDARKRLLPSIVQQQYQQAKGAFERDEFAAAALAFERVLQTLDDPDITAAAAQPPLADLRTLASGFHDLSVKAIPPPAPIDVPEPVKLPQVYTAADPDVVPPATIQQDLPRFPGRVRSGGMSGVIEVVIDERGGVESASTVVSLGSSYDALVLAAASDWRYKPATVSGTPVKFRKRIQIAVTGPPN